MRATQCDFLCVHSSDFFAPRSRFAGEDTTPRTSHIFPRCFVVEFQRHVWVTEFVLVEMADVCYALFSSFGTWFHVTRMASVSCAAENYACEPQSVTLRVSSVFTRCIPHWPIALSRPSGHPASLRCMIVHDSHHVVDGNVFRFACFAPTPSRRF